MSAGAGGQPGDRVLLLAPTLKDASTTQQVFAAVGVVCTPCSTVGALCDQVARGAGAVILTDHAFALKDIKTFADLLHHQPPWSDLPVVLLAQGGADTPAGRRATQLLGNVTVLERPVHMSSLASVVRTLIRSRQRQYQIREHLDERERAREEAERASRMKDEFLATLSHELRTPLNAILGWAHILSQPGRNDQDLSEGLQAIERNARVQTQIVGDLLEMSRIISGKLRLDMRRTDLVLAVREAVETVMPTARAKGVRLEAELDAPMGEVLGDAGRLQQVFWNLLSNAVKFTPEGGRVQVRHRRFHSQVEVSVEDSGEGIAAEFLPSVFDRFRQADASSTRRHGGLGLGLAIVKQLVELHGGMVRAHSAGPGRGSTFVVALPIASNAPEPASAEPLASPPSAPVPGPSNGQCPELEGLKVLVVDDEADARTLMKRLLEDCHAAVITAESPRDALARLEAERPDVLVSDIGMPGEDGYDLIRKVRALGSARGGDIPAVAVTAYARSEDRARAIKHGYQMHVSKPVEPAEFVATVARLAGRLGPRVSS